MTERDDTAERVHRERIKAALAGAVLAMAGEIGAARKMFDAAIKPPADGGPKDGK